MGQINCQQCTFPQLQSIPVQQAVLTRSNKNQKNLNRINIISKRGSVDMFDKKYSVESTKIDTEEQLEMQFMQGNCDKLCIVLVNQVERLQFEVPKDTKILVGTSNNCHVNINRQLVRQNKFKIQLSYENQQVFAKDMAIGQGSWIKSSLCILDQESTLSDEVFMIDSNFISVTVGIQNRMSKKVHLTLQDMIQKKQQQYSFQYLDILLQKKIQSSFYVNEQLTIFFTLQINKAHQLQLLIKNPQCWKYIKHKTPIRKDQTLRLGSQVYQVQNIFPLGEYSSDEQIKIIDYE